MAFLVRYAMLGFLSRSRNITLSAGFSRTLDGQKQLLDDSLVEFIEGVQRGERRGGGGLIGIQIVSGPYDAIT